LARNSIRRGFNQANVDRLAGMVFSITLLHQHGTFNFFVPSASLAGAGSVVKL